jgi:hypothetical protein
MSYPILKTNKALNVGAQISRALALNPNEANALSADFQNLMTEVEYRKGGDWDEQKFLHNVAIFERNMSEDRRNGTLSRVRMEEDFAQHFQGQMNLVSDAALQDPDFWRFLALFPYRRYVFNLEGDLAPSRFGGNGNRSLNRWTLIRGYLWGSRTADIENEEDPFFAANNYRETRKQAGLGEGWLADFYINQIVRRYWSYNKDTYLAFIEATTESPALLDLSNETRPTQKFGARVARIGANLYFPALSREEIKEAMLEEKQKVSTVPQGLVN